MRYVFITHISFLYKYLKVFNLMKVEKSDNIIA